MTLCHNNCNQISEQKTGNGDQVEFSFSFQYNEIEDVKVANYNEDLNRYESVTTGWSYKNDTVIEFDVPPSFGQDFIIYRCTDITTLPSTFYPGTAIKAQDLNDNFFVLQSAIQDTQCGIERLSDETLTTEDVVSQEEQQTDGAADSIDDQHIFSTGASTARHDAYVQDTLPAVPTYEQPGKTWQNTDKCWTSYWQDSPSDNGGASKTWVAYVNTGPRGEKGDKGDPGTSFPDVPVDNILYGRQNQNWVPVVIPGGTLTGITGSSPIVVDNTNPVVPAVSLDLSVLTDI